MGQNRDRAEYESRRAYNAERDDPDRAEGARRWQSTHALSSLQNIRLSADVATR
jgi:hypothetical protein